MLKEYRLSFDVYALLLFLVIMCPNVIWFFIPAQNDILRVNSITGLTDTVASVCQVWMLAFLCFFKNRESQKMCVTPFMILSAGCCLLYFASWAGYYAGFVNKAVILGLTVFPCFAFLFFAVDRKNKLAVVPIVIFTICHLIYGVVNFNIYK